MGCSGSAVNEDMKSEAKRKLKEVRETQETTGR
jgi:hypothetical protein